MELSQIEKQIEDAIETLRRNGRAEPFKFECNEQLYRILEQSPYVDNVGKGLHYYSKKDGSVVYVPKPASLISSAFGETIFTKEMLDRMMAILEDMKNKPFEEHFDPVYFRWEEPYAKKIKIKKIKLTEELTPYERVIQAKKNREVYIPEKLKRKRWNEPYNKK